MGLGAERGGPARQRDHLSLGHPDADPWPDRDQPDRGRPEYTLALRSNGTVLAWGENADGQLGDGTTTQRHTPVQVPGLTGIVQVSANDPSFAVRFTGAVFAWGRNGNDSGVLGLGATGDVATPTHGWMFAVAMQAPPPPSAVVPNLSGDSRSQAGQALQAVGLVLGTVSTVVDNSCNNLGTVLSQSPAAGAHVSLGSAVSITVGTPPKHPCP